MLQLILGYTCHNHTVCFTDQKHTEKDVLTHRQIQWSHNVYRWLNIFPLCPSDTFTKYKKFVYNQSSNLPASLLVGLLQSSQCPESVLVNVSEINMTMTTPNLSRCLTANTQKYVIFSSGVHFMS